MCAPLWSQPDNVLLTLDGYIKLADMGAARGIAENGAISNGATSSSYKTVKAGAPPTLKRRMTITGTHGYRAPEVYDRDYGKEADWSNVGIMIIEMLTAENPFRGSNRKESEQLTKHKPLALPSYIQVQTRPRRTAPRHADAPACPTSAGHTLETTQHSLAAQLLPLPPTPPPAPPHPPLAP